MPAFCSQFLSCTFRSSHLEASRHQSIESQYDPRPLVKLFCICMSVWSFSDWTRHSTVDGTTFHIFHVLIFFPTCQVRVVRFYQGCCSSPPPPSSPPPSPPPPLPPLPCPLPPCQLLVKLFANFRAQWALLDLNCRLPIWVGTAGPQPQGSERTGHRWTSTWDLRTSVHTAGPQPGTLRAQWAPLDLNGQIECQKVCQIKCQNVCPIICQKYAR